MNAPLNLRFDNRAFLTWLADREGRYELQSGNVIMQANVTRGHVRIANAFAAALRARLALADWDVFAESFGVEIGSSIRYPDVIVEAAGKPNTELTTFEPTLLVEVLSPSSAATDLNIKPQEYLTLDSLEVYIVASQDEPICWVWQRAGADRAFPKVPEEFAGRDKAMSLAAFGIALPLADLFQGIGTA